MTKFIWAYLSTACIFLAADMVWLGLIARNFYKTQMGSLLSDHPSAPPAVIFYACYVVGIVAFGVSPGLRAGSWTYALAFGALFGFMAYGTYDLTNLAVVRDWPRALALVDLAWGTAVTAAAACGGYLVASRFA